MLLGRRPMVGHENLGLAILVRVQTSQFLDGIRVDENQIRGLLRGKDHFPLKLGIFIAKEGMTAIRRRAPEGKPLGLPMGRSTATTGSSEPTINL